MSEWNLGASGHRSAKRSVTSKGLSAVLLFLLACAPAQDAPSMSELSSQPSGRPVALPTIGGIGAITWMSDTTVAVLDARGEPFVTIVDVMRDSVISQGVRSGDGPGELRHPTAMWSTREGELVLFEPNRRRVMLLSDVSQPSQSRFVNLPVPMTPGVLPPEGALISGAGTLITGSFGDTTALFVPAGSDALPHIVLEGPNLRANVDPAPLFDANWHSFTVDEQTGRAALAFLFAPLVLVMDSTGQVLHEVAVGTLGAPRRGERTIGPGYDVDASDIASRAVSLRGHTLALAYCGCLGTFVADSTRHVLLYDLRDSMRSARVSMSESVKALALSPNGQRLVMGFNDPEPHLEVIDVGERALIWRQ